MPSLSVDSAVALSGLRVTVTATSPALAAAEPALKGSREIGGKR